MFMFMLFIYCVGRSRVQIHCHVIDHTTLTKMSGDKELCLVLYSLRQTCYQ